MLVLSRKSGESIEIGDGVTITVLKIGAGRVKIGVTAPEAVDVVRGELHEENPCPVRGVRAHPRPVCLPWRSASQMGDTIRERSTCLRTGHGGGLH